MASKKLASKKTKELITDTEIKEKKLDKADFTTSWQGRIGFLNAEKSEIAKKLGVTEKKEYAIKIR